MKRLGIFAFYDKEGIVDSCFVKLLKDIRPYVTELISVCNVDHIMEDKEVENLRSVSDQVIIRNNTGYDAGAYKEIFLRMEKENCLKGWDSVLLFNSTFFGMFYPLDHFFSLTETRKEIDYWGLTKHIGAKDEGEGIYPDHVQSYFLLIQKKMFQSRSFMDFWHQLDAPFDYNDAVRKFEIGFNVFFKEKGFKGEAYCSCLDKTEILKKGDNPYINYSYELITNLSAPFLKIKTLLFGYNCAEYLLKSMQAVAYVKNRLSFDDTMIWKYLLRSCRNGAFQAYFNYDDLESFYNEYRRIFIYGAGRVGQAMYSYFTVRGWDISAMLVTDKDAFQKKKWNDNIMVLEAGEVTFEKEDGIILAMNYENSREVIEQLKLYVEEQQIFMGK